jgi:hypothetical protein
MRVFKIYLRVFKILFEGVQHLYNTCINYLFIYSFFLLLFNTSGCAIAHSHQYVAPPLHMFVA